MKRLRTYFPLFLVMAFLGSCDIVDDPIPPNTSGTTINDDSTVIRKILLEEFTGHQCNSCPAAHLVASQLKTLYPEDIVVVGIHATATFAAPQSNPDGSYSTDFRTPAAAAFVNSFGVTFLPTGLLNRTLYSGSITISHDAWSSAAADLIGQPAALDIWFSQLTHDPGTSTVSAEVKVAVLEPISGDHNLSIYLTEDHVIDWQLNSQASPPDIPDYDHRHVLRDNINGTWGAPLITGSAAVGDTLSLIYTGFAMDPGWNAANCALVAFVYNTDTYEVLQTEERNFQP